MRLNSRNWQKVVMPLRASVGNHHRDAKFGTSTTWQRRTSRSLNARSHFAPRKQTLLRHSTIHTKLNLNTICVKYFIQCANSYSSD